MYQTKLLEKLKEALGAVMPIALIVLVLSLTVVPVPSGTLLTFLFGSGLLVIGMMFFSVYHAIASRTAPIFATA